MYKTLEESQPPLAYKAMKIMSPAQANELSRALCGNHDRAGEIQPMCDEFVAHSIIVGYMSKPMLSDDGVRTYIKNRLGLES